MRKKAAIVFTCLFCLIFMGCSAGGNPTESTADNTTSITDGSTSSEKETLPPETVREGDETDTKEETTKAGEDSSLGSSVSPSRPGVIGTDPVETVSGTPVAFEGEAIVRIPYTVNQNAVFYITSAEELAAFGVEELNAYEEDFFRTKALVVIKETVTSGSTKVGIQSITQEDSVVSVTLSHEAAEVGTTDMATWLIWAEVDRGLEDCQWVLTNPALESQLEVQ